MLGHRSRQSQCVAWSGRTGSALKSFQEKSVTSDETGTTFESVSRFSNLRSAEIMPCPVQEGHRTGGIELGAAHRGLDNSTDGLRLVLDTQQIDIEQSGLNKPDPGVGVSDGRHKFEREGVAQCSPCSQLVCDFVAVRLQR